MGSEWQAEGLEWAPQRLVVYTPPRKDKTPPNTCFSEKRARTMM